MKCERIDAFVCHSNPICLDLASFPSEFYDSNKIAKGDLVSLYLTILCLGAKGSFIVSVYFCPTRIPLLCTFFGYNIIVKANTLNMKMVRFHAIRRSIDAAHVDELLIVAHRIRTWRHPVVCFVTILQASFDALIQPPYTKRVLLMIHNQPNSHE